MSLDRSDSQIIMQVDAEPVKAKPKRTTDVFVSIFDTKSFDPFDAATRRVAVRLNPKSVSSVKYCKIIWAKAIIPKPVGPRALPRNGNVINGMKMLIPWMM